MQVLRPALVSDAPGTSHQQGQQQRGPRQTGSYITGQPLHLRPDSSYEMFFMVAVLVPSLLSVGFYEASLIVPA